MRIKLATTCDKNEQQQDAKNNAKFIMDQMDEEDWKTSEKNVRGGRNISIKVYLVTDDDDVDDDNEHWNILKQFASEEG